jgi:hypothetical protein
VTTMQPTRAVSTPTGRLDWRQLASTSLGVLAGVIAAAGTLAVIVAGFTLSYDAVRRVAVAAGVNADRAWLMPVSIDGAMAVATVTAVVLSRMGRAVIYPWAVVLAGAGISIACNAVHARMRDGLALDDATAMAVSAIPAVMLTLSVHLLVVLVEAVARKVAPQECLCGLAECGECSWPNGRPVPETSAEQVEPSRPTSSATLPARPGAARRPGGTRRQPQPAGKRPAGPRPVDLMRRRYDEMVKAGQTPTAGDLNTAAGGGQGGNAKRYLERWEAERLSRDVVAEAEQLVAHGAGEQ